MLHAVPAAAADASAPAPCKAAAAALCAAELPSSFQQPNLAREGTSMGLPSSIPTPSLRLGPSPAPAAAPGGCAAAAPQFAALLAAAEACGQPGAGGQGSAAVVVQHW